MNQSITLNLPHDLAEANWVKVMVVYRSMDGWVEGEELPCWFGTLNATQYVAPRTAHFVGRQ